MKNVVRFFLAIAATFLAFSAVAEIVPSERWRAYSTSSGATVYGASPDAACSALPTVPPRPGYFGDGEHYFSPPSTCSCPLLNDDLSVSHIGSCGSVTKVLMCPDNSVQLGELCVCNHGFEEKDGQCVEPNKCEQGKTQRLSFLAGWLYEDSEGEWVGDSGRRVTFGKGPWDPPATYCDGSCLWVQDGVVELKWNLDETNANGWSKAVAESDYESTNGECTTKTKDRDDEPPETKPNLNGGGDDNNGGGDDNNGGGGDNNGGGGDNNGGGGDHNGGGGDNNGGGDAGGPSGGGSGGDSSGEEDDGKEKKTCGLPGTPPCKIDESGTPGEFKNDGKGLDTWKSSVEANRDQIKGSGGNTFDGFRGFFSAPPLTACRPIDLPGGVAWEKQCEVVDTGRAIMGYVWALVALFCCLGWIREAV